MVAAVKRLDLSRKASAVLTVMCEQADGAGFCWPSVKFIKKKTGYARATIFRALIELEEGDDPLLKRWRLLRDPARYPDELPHRARQGNGHAVYRVGSLLRLRAGLAEVDEVAHLGGVRSEVSRM